MRVGAAGEVGAYHGHALGIARALGTPREQARALEGSGGVCLQPCGPSNVGSPAASLPAPAAGKGLPDARSRYLPFAATAATTATAQVNPVADTEAVAAVSATYPDTRGQRVADTAATGETAATYLTSEVAVVAAVADISDPPRDPR
ncbi:MAG: hypothetical protein JO115_19520 [Pseudonocardiales bacterium]|nr:hypothetical protein [Pseudonocardiales bacterium]